MVLCYHRLSAVLIISSNYSFLFCFVGVRSVQGLLKISSLDLTSLSVSNLEKLTRTLDNVILTEWLKEKSLVSVKDILRSQGINRLEELKQLDQEEVNDILKLIKNKNDHQKFAKLVNEFQGVGVAEEKWSVPTVKCELIDFIV